MSKALFGSHFNSNLFMVPILTLLSLPIPKGPNLKAYSYGKVSTINTMEFHNGCSLNNTMTLESSTAQYISILSLLVVNTVSNERSQEGKINEPTSIRNSNKLMKNTSKVKMKRN